MDWFTGSDLYFDFSPQGTIEDILFKGQSLCTVGKMQFPTLELGIKVGESKTIVQPLVVTQNVRRSQSALTVPFDACLDSDNLSQWPISGCYSMEILANGEIRWQLYINNNSKNPVCEILYPRTMPVYFSPEAVLMYPHHAGERIENIPRALSTDKYQRFWRANSVETDFGYMREINYCGLASMTWMDISDGSVGMYVGSHDPSFPVTGLRIETGGPADPWVSLSFRKYVDVPPGASYQAQKVVWAFHGGDWHLSAHRYRTWFDAHVQQMEHPGDLGQELVLSPHYNFRRFEGIRYRFEDIPEMAERDRKEFESRHFFIAGWNHMGFDSHYPNYNPDLELGTPLALQQGVKAVNDGGGFVTFYINSRIMDKYSEYADTIGEKWMLRNLQLRPIEEQYGPAETFVLCPSHPAWRKHLYEFALWMCRAYGARGIYFDQLGSATPYPCYSDHDHQDLGTGGFNRAYIDLLEQTAAGLRQIRPDSFLMIENCGDVYSSRVWGSLAWNGEDYDEFFNLYKYTFPEHTLINMVNPRRMEDGELQEKAFYQDLARAFLLGSVFWFEGDAFKDRITDTKRRGRMLSKLHEALAVRAAVSGLLNKAIFRDDLHLRLPAGIFGTYWELPANGGLALLVNNEKRRCRICLADATCQGHSWKVFNAESGAWSEVFPARQNGQLVFDVPLQSFGVLSWSD